MKNAATSIISSRSVPSRVKSFFGFTLRRTRIAILPRHGRKTHESAACEFIFSPPSPHAIWAFPGNNEASDTDGLQPLFQPLRRLPT